MMAGVASSRRYAFPIFAALTVGVLSTLLLTVGARSPYTHANLAGRFDPTYGRTEQAFVGPSMAYRGAGQTGTAPAVTDPGTRGSALLVNHGCASCHGLDGRGATVGPPIAGFDATDMRAKTDRGPGGMPAYGQAVLSESDLDAIAAHLESLRK